MELSKFFAILRKQLVVVLACTALGAIIGAVIAMTTPKTYSAKTETYFTVASGDLTQASAFTTGMLKSYATAAQSDFVLEPAAQKLGAGATSDDLRNKVAVVVPAGTSIIEITATDSTPQRAADIANAVTDSLKTASAELSPDQVAAATGTKETPGKAVKAQILDSASPQSSPTSPRLPLDVAVGAVVGLLAGIVAALVRASRQSTGVGTRAAAGPESREAR